MDAEELARLRRNLDAATDEALVALANRGLVRRAAKDLEQAPPFTVELRAAAVLVHGVGWTVTMPADGPAAATDNTPATGVTRQIIAATMFLRDHWRLEGAQTPTETDAESGQLRDEAIEEAAERLSEAPAGELFKWSGRTPLLEASAAVGSVGKAAISYAPHLTVEFPEPGVRVVLMTDRPAKSLRRLLDQFKTTAGKSEHPRWVLQAVLALKQSRGKDPAIATEPGFELTAAIREDRQGIARRVQNLLGSVAASGIAHPSSRIVERLRTAGVAAEAARFPRLARLLNSIADDAQLQIARDAAADPARMMQRMVVAHALAEAAARSENAERGDLFGRPRTHYAPAGDLQLCGVGAYGWRTASGFEGLTTVFWDAPGKRFLTASVARGEGQEQTFSLAQAYEGGLGWSGGAVVRTMCRSQLTLSAAKTNVDGRLSLSETCRAALGEPTDPGGLDFGEHAVSRWAGVAKIAQRSQPIGLRVPDPRAAYVVLQPKHWGQRWFDELDQAFVWQLYDEAAAAMEVRVPWTPSDETSVAFLESLQVDRDKPTSILGRLEVRGGTLCLYPFSLFSSGTVQGDKVLCPQFDQARIRSRNEPLLQRLRAKFPRDGRIETRIGVPDSNELGDTTAADSTNISPLLRAVILDVDRILSAALESGATRLTPAVAQTLSKTRDRLAELGVSALTDTLTLLLTDSTPVNFLRAAYRLHLFRQSLRLCQLP